MKSTTPIPAILLALTSVTLLADDRPSVLSDALRRGDWASVKAAIDNGADVESADERGNTLLMETAVFGNTANLEYLLAHGANANATNKAGHTALMRAIPDIAKIKLLVEHGAGIRAVTKEGSTALMMAARLPAASELVTYLVAHGSEVARANSRRFDAVMMAADQGEAENLRILLEAGAAGAARIQNVVVKSRPGNIVFSGPSLEILRRRPRV